jgi:hypothetical protein
MLAADVVHGIVCSTENRPAELDSAPRFDRHAKHSGIPLLANFWAGWCGLCKAMTRVFEKGGGRARSLRALLKVDSDAVPELLQRFGIHMHHHPDAGAPLRRNRTPFGRHVAAQAAGLDPRARYGHQGARSSCVA